MATQQEMLEAFAPEFFGDARIALALELAAQQLREAAWGSVYDQAVAYLAAHLLTTWGPAAGVESGEAAGTAGGPVTSRSADDVSESYGNALNGVSGLSVSDALLATTTHGRAFLALRKSRAAGAPGLALAGRARGRAC